MGYLVGAPCGLPLARIRGGSDRRPFDDPPDPHFPPRPSTQVLKGINLRLKKGSR